MSTTLIIGPSSAGKTVLLASLEQATLTHNESCKYVVAPKSDPMKALLKNARKTVRAGQPIIKAGDKVDEYSFSLNVKRGFVGRYFHDDRYVGADFTMLDGPGGVIFGEAAENRGQVDSVVMKQYRDLLV